MPGAGVECQFYEISDLNEVTLEGVDLTPHQQMQLETVPILFCHLPPSPPPLPKVPHPRFCYIHLEIPFGSACTLIPIAPITPLPRLQVCPSSLVWPKFSNKQFRGTLSPFSPPSDLTPFHFPLVDYLLKHAFVACLYRSRDG